MDPADASVTPREQPSEVTTNSRNEALWLLSPGGEFEVRPAARPTAGPGEVVVRVRAVAVNPVDTISGSLRRIISPWLRYPAVIGIDLAGEIVEVGDAVDGLEVGDRVLAYAAGQERSRNTAAEGAFQRYAVVLDRVCTPIPRALSFEEAAVLPLGLATAAAGLFEEDQLALPLPKRQTRTREEVVLVWGGSSSVGCNAVQLARASGFEVIATASRRNHELLHSLGAADAFDYRDADVDDRIVEAIGDRDLVGVIAVGSGSLTHALRIARRTRGRKRIASVLPDPVTRLRGVLARLGGVRVSVIWGGTPIRSAVGPAIFRQFLPAALEEGRFRPAPAPRVAASGLDGLPTAFEALRAGVSASKIVVTIP